jgi:hypothetical protein
LARRWRSGPARLDDAVQLSRLQRKVLAQCGHEAPAQLRLRTERPAIVDANAMCRKKVCDSQINVRY